jgi:hypothetical protein
MVQLSDYPGPDDTIFATLSVPKCNVLPETKYLPGQIIERYYTKPGDIENIAFLPVSIPGAKPVHPKIWLSADIQNNF